MAITELDVFAHLTDADIENLGVELDAIRQESKTPVASAMPATSTAPLPRNAPWKWPAG